MEQGGLGCVGVVFSADGLWGFALNMKTLRISALVGTFVFPLAVFLLLFRPRITFLACFLALLTRCLPRFPVFPLVLSPVLL